MIEQTLAANWLNTFFASYDHAILQALHNMAVATGGRLNFFFEGFSLLGSSGIALILLGIILLFFKKSRKTGFCILLAIAFGWLITNLTLKNLVARARPFVADMTYYSWWQNAGAVFEDEFSFPSGHTTVSMSAMTSIFLTTNRKKSWPVFFFVAMMGISRNYLMVHYPSDILGGIVVGLVDGLVAAFVVNRVIDRLRKNREAEND